MTDRKQKLKILIIGGSYFLGRAFVKRLLATAEHEVTVLNRGSLPLRLPGLEELVCSRNDVPKLQALLSDRDFDFVVDFCAYHPGEIQTLFREIRSIGSYVLLSTPSVYRISDTLLVDESHPTLSPELWTRGEAKDPFVSYVLAKAALEQELVDQCKFAGSSYTIFRPTFIYGPLNYAKRETFYFDYLYKDKPLPYILDADQALSFVFVNDVAKVLEAALAQESMRNEIYNLAGSEEITQNDLIEVLAYAKGAEVSLDKRTRAEWADEGVELPYLFSQREVYDNRKVRQELDFDFTPFAEGLSYTYRIYESVQKAQEKTNG